VAWSDTVYLTGADADKREVYAFDAATGRLRWRQPADGVPGRPVPSPKVTKDTSYAPSTAATDGQRVAAIFVNGDLVCFSADGKRLWGRSLGVPDNHYGHGSSLTFHRNLLLVLFDQGDEEAQKSRLLALDFATGRTVWQGKRPGGASWSTPIVFEAAGKTQVVGGGNPWLEAHDVADGSELWRAKQNGEIAPSPVFADGRVFVVNPSDSLIALRPDGRGDVSKTHRAWRAEDGIPDISSPLADGRRVYLLATPGLLTCYDAASGAKRWEHDFELECNASPALAGDRVLIFTLKGVGIAVAAADEFRELGRSDLKEPVHASPAFLGNRMFVRGKKTLFAVGNP
jgi:outer membrane protein assembly factor BamB